MKCKRLLYLERKALKDKHAQDKKYCKEVDHCHDTRKYRVSARSICNSQNSVTKKITLVFFLVNPTKVIILP